jgi:hypothetical protein
MLIVSALKIKATVAAGPGSLAPPKRSEADCPAVASEGVSATGSVLEFPAIPIPDDFLLKWTEQPLGGLSASP